jgi:hypothetical protein
MCERRLKNNRITTLVCWQTLDRRGNKAVVIVHGALALSRIILSNSGIARVVIVDDSSAAST